MPGRKPLPAKLKTARGNPGKRPVKPNPQATAGVPEPPPSVKNSAVALAEYARMAGELEKMKVGTVLDLTDLRDHAICYAEVERCAEKLSQPLDPKTYGEIRLNMLNWMKTGQAAREKLCITKASMGRLYGSNESRDPSEDAADELGLS